ncbi:hypothetical protein [Tortoise microvirus 78]|nr:hypothetical protein [Tortoise microvirus 78]
MLKKLGINILFPLLGRAGTAAATWLVSIGANSDHAAQVSIGLIALGLIALDLAGSWLMRKLNETGWNLGLSDGR